MFVSKILNKLFFNTNNDCCFTTLLNLNQFMLTKDNYKRILDIEPKENIPDNTGLTSSSKDEIDFLSVKSSEDLDFSIPSSGSEKPSESFGDDELLKRKNEFQHEQRCITPTTQEPFSLPEQITPENLFRPIEAVPTPANIMEIIETPFSGEYSPKQNDTLFWCIYIIANGYGEYINIDRNYGLKELEIKKQIGEFNANKGYLKSTPNYKITNNLRGEIHSELFTSQKDTSFPCLLILCCYYKINVVLLHPNGKLMLEFISNTDAETSYYVLKKNIQGKYSVNTDKKTWKDVQEMKTKYVCIGNYMKPIKAAGNYKMEDLEEFAEKLGVLDVTKKYKKIELYQLVQQNMNWFP